MGTGFSFLTNNFLLSFPGHLFCKSANLSEMISSILSPFSPYYNKDLRFGFADATSSACQIRIKQGQIISPVILAVGARLQPLGNLLPVDFLFLGWATYSSGQIAEFGI